MIYSCPQGIVTTVERPPRKWEGFSKVNDLYALLASQKGVTQ